MNKKLVAAAIAGLLAAPLVQAQTANVTLYGRANLDMEVVSGQLPNGTNPNQYRVSANSSRFGLRGTESLGGGINAIFQLENSISWDNGAGTLAGRDSFVGFQGTFGRFIVGRYHAPYDNIHELWGDNPTFLTSILATSALWAQGGQAKANGGFDDRVGNSVRYDTPVMSGFQAQVQYGAGGSATSTEGVPKSNSGVGSAGFFYNNGPLKLGAAFQTNNSFRGIGLNDLAWSVAGGWQFPMVYVGAVYEKLDYDVQVNATTKGNLTRGFYGIGVTVDLGGGQLYADYSRAEEGKGSAPNGTRIGGLAKGPDTEANQWEISYTYPLSKRTSVYGGYVKIDNARNASYIFGVNGFTTAVGGKPGGAILGVVHNF